MDIINYFCLNRGDFMLFSILLTEGLSESGKAVFKGFSTIALAILGIFCALAIILGFFNDKINSIFCIIIAIAGFFFVPKLNGIASVNPIKNWTFIFICLMIVRFLPLIHLEENSTYLILGTLVEEQGSITGGLLTLFVSGLFGAGYYFIADFAVNNGFYNIGYIAIGIFLVFGLVGFIRSCFD